MSVSGNGSSASTDSWFDANGFLVATDRSESTPDKPLGNALVNDAQGRVLYNNQGAARPFDTNTAGFGRIENQAGGFIGGFIGNDSNRGHVQRQLIVNGEVLARYGDELVAKLNSTTFTPTSVAEFQFGAAPLNVRQSNLDAQRYTVSGGETLRSIARSFYGDDKLWYLIAQANGLSGSTQLSTGQTLSIPKLSASSNAADSFKPYDPSKVVGDLTPNLPMPQNDKGCGALGQIIMIVVAIVVTIYTAGAAATSLSSAAAASSAAGASTMSIGAGALLGGTGAAAGMSAGSLIAAGAIGGAVGSIASQLVGNAIGAVDGFSWKQVALGGLSAGMGAGLGQIAALAGTTPGAVIARAAIGDAMTQGIALVTGLQDHFDWKGVAASAVGAGVGYGMNEAFGLTQNGLATNNYTGFDKYALAGLSGFAAGTAAAAARGGRVSVQQVATDAFGNSLASVFVDNLRSPGQQDVPIDESQRKAMELGFGPLNPSAASQAMFISQFDLRSHFAQTDGTDQFVPIDAIGSSASVMGAGETMSVEEFRRQEITYRNRTEGVDAAVQDADLHRRGPRLSVAGFAGYEALGKEMVGWPVNKAFRSNDPNHYVLGAYSDSTWNKRPGEDLLDIRPGIDYTNVGLLQLLSQGASNTNFQTKYFPGVGTDWYTKHLGGATGAGVTMGAEEAYKWTSDNVNEIYSNNPKATFDFLGVGFSRGALETRMLLRMIDQRGIPDYASRCEVMHGEANTEVRYERNIIEPGKANLNAVIFDTVTTGAGDLYNIDLPTRAQVYHPIARDEMRALFPSAPLARAGQEMSPSWFQPVVAGDHSDIGNNHDRGGIGDMNLKLAHQFMSQNLGLPMMAIPSAYTPNEQNMWIHDMRGNDGVAPRGNSPFVRPVAPRYLPVQPNPSPYQR